MTLEREVVIRQAARSYLTSSMMQGNMPTERA